MLWARLEACTLCNWKSKGKLRKECYTNSNLAQLIEVIQVLMSNDVSFMLHPTNRYSKQEACLLFLVAVSMTSYQTDIAAVCVQTLWLD